MLNIAPYRGNTCSASHLHPPDSPVEARVQHVASEMRSSAPTYCESLLTDERQKLTFTFASGHREVIGRADIEALTRYLMDHARVAPLVVDEDVLKDIQPKRVDM